jgi:ribosomal protein S18 acetylase RimI-like enzyme
VDGRPVGFAETGPCRDADGPPGAAELSTLYLEQAAAGRGIGRRLLAHAMADLRRRGYRVATLWVLAGNGRARRFYAAAGWAPDGTTRPEEWSGVELEGVRYRIDLAAPAGS